MLSSGGLTTESSLRWELSTRTIADESGSVAVLNEDGASAFEAVLQSGDVQWEGSMHGFLDLRPRALLMRLSRLVLTLRMRGRRLGCSGIAEDVGRCLVERQKLGMMISNLGSTRNRLCLSQVQGFCRVRELANLFGPKADVRYHRLRFTPSTLVLKYSINFEELMIELCANDSKLQLSSHVHTMSKL